MNNIKRPHEVIVPDDLLANWQSIVNTMAELSHIPAGLIMRITEEDIEVFVTSHTDGNPYHPGDREHLVNSGLYCETVIKNKQSLLVPDALSDPKWKDNPDVKLNMISYLGFPILFPDDSPFGTLCVLDNKPNSYSDTIYSLLENFRDLIQQHLALLYMNATLGEKNTRLVEYLDELQSLRGLIPICAQCKKIRDSEGYWHAVEKYLINHPEADFTHGYCPECAKRALDEFRRS
ncbi:GAF domain-containing protein [Candidatus Zixiibacteriota bacterium]